MAMAHMQRCGNRPICLMGGGTGMIGDPSGKADMRKMMTVETIDHNVACIKKQLSRFINFDEGEGGAIIANNADWLRNLNYIEFLREIGTHFSVNRMLAADCFKTRMDRELGLSFLEFNYMIMQGYDFYELNKRYNCMLEMGGNDQWSNIIAGVELIRRKAQKPAYGMTFKLLTNSEGVKMGKTVSGAVWLDPEKTSPYEFYQYWRNIGDKDVEKCLALLTFLPMDEVRRLGALEGAEINHAKEVLAFELTKKLLMANVPAHGSTNLVYPFFAAFFIRFTKYLCSTVPKHPKNISPGSLKNAIAYQLSLLSFALKKAPYPFGCDAVVFGPEPCDEQGLNYGIVVCCLHQLRILY